MEVRQYDPAIARWTGIDPVTHHNFSPYNAFDNNPVFWADPSGADGEKAVPGSTVEANKGLPLEIQMAQNTGMGDHITHGAQLGNNSAPRDGGTAINAELNKGNPIIRSGPSLSNGNGTNFSSTGLNIQMGAQGIGINGVSFIMPEQNGVLSQFFSGLGGAYGQFYGNLWDKISNPFDTMRDYALNEHWKSLIPGYGVYNYLENNAIDPIKTAYAGFSSLAEGDYYGAGFASGSLSAGKTLDAALAFATVGAVKGLSFKLNGGYGVFGRKGLNIGNYRIEALYANSNAGNSAGTFLSIKQMKNGGNLFRLDYGRMHKSTNMSLHYTYRYNIFGRKFGSTRQRNIIKF